MLSRGRHGSFDTPGAHNHFVAAGAVSAQLNARATATAQIVTRMDEVVCAIAQPQLASAR